MVNTPPSLPPSWTSAACAPGAQRTPACLKEGVEVEEEQLVHAHGARHHVEHGEPRLKPLVPALQPLEQLLGKALHVGQAGAQVYWWEGRAWTEGGAAGRLPGKSSCEQVSAEAAAPQGWGPERNRMQRGASRRSSQQQP